MLSHFRFKYGHSLHQQGLNYLGLHHCNPLRHTTARHLCLLALVCGPYRSAPSNSSSQCFGMTYVMQTAVSSAIQSKWWGCSFGDSLVIQILSPSLEGRKEFSFQSLVTPVVDLANYKSVVGIKPGVYHMVIGYQIHEVTYTQSVDFLLLNHKLTPGSQARHQL